MNVYVDDCPFAVAEADAPTVGEAISAIRRTFDARSRIVVGLRFDGLDVGEDDLLDALRRPLVELERLDVSTESPDGIVREVLGHALTALDNVAAELSTAAGELTTGKTGDGMQRISGAFGQCQQINEAIGKSLGLLGIDPDSVVVAGRSGTEAILAPRELLTQIRDVVEAGDHVLLADILQYEFDTVAKQWRGLIEAMLERATDVPQTATPRLEGRSASDQRNFP